MPDIDAMFDAMRGAKMGRKGQWLTDGQYLIKLSFLGVKKKEIGSGTNGIVEFEVVKTSNPEHPVGSTRSWVRSMDSFSFWDNIMAIVLSATGFDPRQLKPEDTELRNDATTLAAAICGGEKAIAVLKAKGFDNPNELLLGKLIKVECRTVPTRGDPTKGRPPGQFTLHDWSPAPAETQAA